MTGDEPYPPDLAVGDIIEWAVVSTFAGVSSQTYIRCRNLESAQVNVRNHPELAIAGRSYGQQWVMLEDLDAWR